MTDRDKPVSNGETYCSPSCCWGCTHKEFSDATEGANKLATILGKGWEPNVWENLGWRYSAVLKEGDGFHQDTMAEVHAPTRGEYWCDTRVNGIQFELKHSNPTEGFQATLDAATKHFEGVRRELFKLKSLTE